MSWFNKKNTSQNFYIQLHQQNNLAPYHVRIWFYILLTLVKKAFILIQALRTNSTDSNVVSGKFSTFFHFISNWKGKVASRKIKGTSLPIRIASITSVPWLQNSGLKKWKFCGLEFQVIQIFISKLVKWRCAIWRHF